MNANEWYDKAANDYIDWLNSAVLGPDAYDVLKNVKKGV